MKFDFGPKVMDIGTFEFNYVRALMTAGTGAADLGECCLVGHRIKEGDTESWVSEWGALADRVRQRAVEALEAGQRSTAKYAFFRASNYYRSALFSARFTDPRYDRYLTASRDCCREAAPLGTPRLEVLEIPFRGARLPGYFLSAGKPKGPTLLVLNGGDTTNEEMVHWLGFACHERGWNFAVFEGPGQWSALQLNPGLHMRPEFEEPTRAVIDLLFERADVDHERLALYGASLGSQLVARVAAHEPRVRACCSDGLVVDVYEAWQAVLPKVVQAAPHALFDGAFNFLQLVSPQARDVATHLKAIVGATGTPHELMDAWKPFTIAHLAERITCPMLLLYGEAEAAQSNEQVMLSAFKFIRQLGGPMTFRVFDYNDGWAASHCHVGGLAALHAVLFGWLDTAVHHPDRLARWDLQPNTADLLAKYVRTQDGRAMLEELRRGNQPSEPGRRAGAH